MCRQYSMFAILGQLVLFVQFFEKITALGAKGEFLRFELSHNALDGKPRK